MSHTQGCQCAECGTIGFEAAQRAAAGSPAVVDRPADIFHIADIVAGEVVFRAQLVVRTDAVGEVHGKVRFVASPNAMGLWPTVEVESEVVRTILSMDMLEAIKTR